MEDKFNICFIIVGVLISTYLKRFELITNIRLNLNVLNQLG